MSVITHLKMVFITYSIVDTRGRVVEQVDMPAGYVHGANSGILPGIEAALAGKQAGDRVEIQLAAADAYGPRDESLVITQPLDAVPPMFREIGAEATFQNESGESRTFRVTKIEDGILTLDGNPPLAGEGVGCHVSVVEVRDATPEEIRAGRPADAAATALH
jgi:FKBP-type peptidyl-prolyl cis-trans isomerase SlyD